MRPSLDSMADVIGAVTAVMGVALVVEPRRSGQAIGLTGPPNGTRAIGVADLVLAPMLLSRRGRRSPPMALRSLLNLVIAATYSREFDRPSGAPRARRGMALMGVLAVVDGGTALLLYRKEGGRP